MVKKKPLVATATSIMLSKDSFLKHYLPLVCFHLTCTFTLFFLWRDRKSPKLYSFREFHKHTCVASDICVIYS